MSSCRIRRAAPGTSASHRNPRYRENTTTCTFGHEFHCPLCSWFWFTRLVWFGLNSVNVIIHTFPTPISQLSSIAKLSFFCFPYLLVARLHQFVCFRVHFYPSFAWQMSSLYTYPPPLFLSTLSVPFSFFFLLVVVSGLHCCVIVVVLCILFASLVDRLL
ncbi:hypothetical protein K474DRAFT_128931 [Panus rudis PR-1116 ss-1]|nr:hypothetical protein K474DRAFT_128931 [Panus rudis PR-1116 ss-1]